MSTNEIREKLMKRFMMNTINATATDSLKIRRVDNKVFIDMNYEERIPFYANVDVVLSFQHHLDSSKPEQCCQP
jgi:S-adenosylmethionine synthetase